MEGVSYRHLGLNEREEISRYLAQGWSFRDISRALSRHVSTISREINRAGMNRATIILTDSGGVQEEAPSLGKPVLVMRETTERPEAVDASTVKLVGTDPKLICSETEKLLTDATAYSKMSRAHNPYGDGKAAARIINTIVKTSLT